ncbi:MAG: ribonuclease H-like domain-containing protein [Planctomycetota bacterium]|jgi:uncharacterized protein YprB with RNaseH-like and TPR domain
MLKSTFCHMPGVGPKTERRLWRAGVLTWQAARDSGALPLATGRAEAVARTAQESLQRLAARYAGYFYDRLPSREHWRLFPEFRSSVAYLDIETTGLAPPRDYITTIALYDGDSVRCYVQGEDLDEFAEDVRRYRLLVTYNGKAFDVPFIRDYFGIPMRHAHIDLRYVLHSLGYAGGLKGCEKQLGLERGELDGVDGYFAVLLWRDFLKNGNRAALQTLMAYNVMDVVSLETLMVLAYNQKVQEAAFPARERLSRPVAPLVPFRPDPKTIERIRRDHLWRY